MCVTSDLPRASKITRTEIPSCFNCFFNQQKNGLLTLQEKFEGIFSHLCKESNYFISKNHCKLVFVNIGFQSTYEQSKLATAETVHFENHLLWFVAEFYKKTQRIPLLYYLTIFLNNNVENVGFSGRLKHENLQREKNVIIQPCCMELRPRDV